MRAAAPALQSVGVVALQLEEDLDPCRRIAADLDARATALLKQGDRKGALALFEEATKWLAVAEERDRLTVGNQPVMVSDKVTHTETARRGASVALTSAKKSGHPVRMAIAASEWKTVTKYAAKRLKRSQAALSRYLTDDEETGLETPPEVADQVRKDFGLGDDVWPRPPRR
jgi:hypothetical protein